MDQTCLLGPYNYRHLPLWTERLGLLLRQGKGRFLLRCCLIVYLSREQRDVLLHFIKRGGLRADLSRHMFNIREVPGVGETEHLLSVIYLFIFLIFC